MLQKCTLFCHCKLITGSNKQLERRKIEICEQPVVQIYIKAC